MGCRPAIFNPYPLVSEPALGYLLWIMPTDEKIDTFALDRVRYHAKWLGRSTTNLVQDIKTLLFWAGKIQTKRPFETQMEAELDDAEKALTDAIQAIKEARETYNALPGKAPAVSQD